MKLDLLLKNADSVLPSGRQTVDIGITDGKIVNIEPNIPSDSAKETIDLTGLTLLPGVIDSQVHFREPGMEHKEDFATGSKAAVRGGVTTVFDMPNTLPPAITREAFEAKKDHLLGRSWCNFGLFAGALPTNLDNLGELEKLDGCVAIKVFMGKSTGGLVVEKDEDIERALSNTKRRFAVHCEDENLLEERKSLIPENATSEWHPKWRNEESAITATKRIVGFAKKFNHPIHVLHVTTAQEMDFLKENKDIASVEVTPQHLTLFAPDCYEKLGSLAQMNPPIRTKNHQDALWKAIDDGTVDVIGSDHAPHTLEEKAKPYPACPSGMPGVQTLLPIMLNHVNHGKLSLERLVQLVCEKPAEIYGMKGKGKIETGYDADFTIVDLKRTETIQNSWIESRCGWTPFEGMKVTGWPVSVIIAGEKVMWDEKLASTPKGKVVEFQ